MARPSLVKQVKGSVYVVQWSSRIKEAKIGFSTNLRQRLPEFLTYSTDRLVVLKVFRADLEKESELHAQFDHCRINGEWFKIDLALRDFLKWKCPCDTKEARQNFGTLHKDRILWRPINPDSFTRLEIAYQNTRLPRFVKNARMYVLWAAQDLIEHGYCCTPAAIIAHPANNPIEREQFQKALYDDKTIYNRLSLLAQEGLILRGENKVYTLTKAGTRELLQTEERSHIFYSPRKSVRPLYPRMDFDR